MSKKLTITVSTLVLSIVAVFSAFGQALAQNASPSPSATPAASASPRATTPVGGPSTGLGGMAR